MRLSDATLGALPASVARPRYDRAAITPGIVHLGLGAFHRAHLAAMTEAVLNAGARDWGIVAASLRSPDTRAAIAPQDGLYTMAVREGEVEALEVIGALRGLHVAPENPAALLAAMADPRTRIVSLTVTEKGYCHDPASGLLDESHPDVRHDLAHPGAPRSAPGFLVEALRIRRAAGTAPFTLLCCDNLPANGRTVQRVVARLGALRDPALGTWIADRVASPSTMVDRIVPATTPDDRARIEGALGMVDRWPVVCERFSQFVVEDVFPLGRPDWGIAGATFTGEVAPFELMKLRLLNGAHSALAYLGYLAGHETVAEAANDPVFAGYLQQLWAEIAPSVPPPPGTDLHDYTAGLLRRFRNHALRHRSWQIAMDGSQKLPQRLLGPLRLALMQGRPAPALVLAIAGWMRFVLGVDERGAPIDVRDPMLPVLREACAPGLDDPRAVAGRMLRIPAIFGVDLPAHPGLEIALAAALDTLARHGTRHALLHHARSRGS